MKLIALSGAPRSGKDTVALHLCHKHKFVQRSFAGPLKEAAAVLLDCPLDDCLGIDYDREQIMPEWGFSMRWFLQRLGTECLRDQIHPDFWVKRMKNELRPFIEGRHGKFDKVVITDCRFQNEVDMVHELGGKVIEIYRDVPKSDHISDKGITPDMIIHNTGTLEALYAELDAHVACGSI